LINKLQVIPLGGLGEFGMHMMALRYGQSAAAERAEQEAMGLSLVDRMRGRS